MLQLDSSYDVVLTYSPIKEITGHIGEVFDYFLFLSNYMNVGILIMSGLSLEQLRIFWESKYIEPFESVIPKLTLLSMRDLYDLKIISFGKKTTVILTDGNIRSLSSLGVYLACHRLLGFMCFDYDFFQIKKNSRITYLQDYRIYGKHRYFPSLNYVKKLPFKYYKEVSSPNKNVGLMYITWACRDITRKQIQEYLEKSNCSEVLVVVPDLATKFKDIPGVTLLQAPVENFLERFDTYIYTPISRQFDCSSRLVVECYMHNKDVFADLPYEDPALTIRLDDARNNLDSLNLKEGDFLLEVL
jgi:hypothetical protein